MDACLQCHGRSYGGHGTCDQSQTWSYVHRKKSFLNEIPSFLKFFLLFSRELLVFLMMLKIHLEYLDTLLLPIFAKVGKQLVEWIDLMLISEWTYLSEYLNTEK